MIKNIEARCRNYSSKW